MVYTIPRKSSGPLSGAKITQATPAPNFQGTYDNQSFQTQDLIGQWHLLTFWAYWCLPCLEELPTLGQLDEQWSENQLKIVAINLDDPQSENFQNAKQFLIDQNLKFQSYFDGDRTIAKAFQIKELPRNLLLNPKGEIVWQASGTKDWSNSTTQGELKKIIESAPPTQPEE